MTKGKLVLASYGWG